MESELYIRAGRSFCRTSSREESQLRRMGVAATPWRWGMLLIVVVSSLLLLIASSSDSIARAQLDYFETCPAAGAPSCTSRVLHFVEDDTQSLADIATLYDVNVTDILGANNLDMGEAGVLNRTIPVGNRLMIPFECYCINGTRRTNTTVYTIAPDDTLSYIADFFYGNLTTYQEIGIVNDIPDVDEIQAGQAFVIPFPCGCHNNTYNAVPAIFLTYVIQMGDALSTIAETYLTNATVLATLNNIDNETLIDAGERIQIPLAACTSDFDTRALDYGLLVPNGTYSLSPEGGCVQSSCYGYPTLELHSIPSGIQLLAATNNSTTCPILECSANFPIGNFTTSQTGNNACTVTSCLYDGYRNSTAIFQTVNVSNVSTCPVATLAPPEGQVETPTQSIPKSSSPPGAAAPPGAPGPSTPNSPSSAAAILRSRVSLINVLGLAFSVAIPLFHLCGLL